MLQFSEKMVADTEGWTEELFLKEWRDHAYGT